MTVLTPESKCHLIAVPLQAWGHARPLTALVARIAQSRPLIITYFAPKHLYHRIETELSRHFGPTQSFMRARVRLVALPSEEDNPLDLQIFYTAVMNSYDKLINEEPLTCAHTGATTDSVRAPDAAILDVFAYTASNYIRKVGHQKTKVYCYTPCAAFATYRLVTQFQTEQRTAETLREKLEQEAAESGRSLDDVAKETFIDVKGTIIRFPGLPPMYDYENFPQEVQITPMQPTFHLSLIEHIVQCDGVIVSAPECFEAPDGIAGLSSWLAQTSRRVYSVGPLLPLESPHAAAQEKALSADAMGIDAFMEKMLRTRGPKTMVFMSFGSLFWPTDPSKVWAFIDVLLDKHIPFIFSHGAQTASVPETVAQKVSSSGTGFLTSWAPQQTILSHPVTGWFTTHGGFNSIIESVTAGVPMICWPYRAEQPLNAMHITDNLDISYELFEVRTGAHVAKPVYRLGRTPAGTLESVRAEAIEVLGKAFGADGERKRERVMRLREKALAAWDEDGSSRAAVESLVEAMHA